MAIASGIHRKRLAAIASGLAIAVAVSLPWSASATSILLVLWLIALIPTLDWSDLRRQLASAAGGLPAMLFLLGALGMLWADVSWHARLGGLDGFVRLLTVPLLMAQFSTTDGGRRVLLGFLASCVVLLIASYVVAAFPHIHERPPGNDGVPVKSYIVQSLEFTMCAAVLAHLAWTKAAARQWVYAAAIGVLALAFLADIFFVVTGRTTLVVIPVLVIVYGFWKNGWKGLVLAGAAGAAIAVVVWFASPYLRERVGSIYSETEVYEHSDTKITSAGLRLEFWKKSIRFIASAPILGHGTGSITEEFDRTVQGQEGARGAQSGNPHNQTFTVGIQLGLLGIALLWAMWIAQLLSFRGAGVVAWAGLVAVTANIVGSLFNSFIFDFTEGWIYIVGVGVVAGLMQRQERRETKD